MNKPITVGVIGAGYWGPNLVRNFNALGDAHMKMVCDKQPKPLEHLLKLYPDVEATLDVRRMFEGGNLDAVAIATPVRTHYQLAKKSLEAGKHTFIEKPMAASSQECEELTAIAKERSLVLMVGHTFLYSPAVHKLREIVNAGTIGEILYIAARRLNLGQYQKDIDVAWDLAPHDISIILYLLGNDPVSVNCNGGAHITPGIADVVSTFLDFGANRSAMIQSSWLDPRKIREMTIVGRKGMIVYNDISDREKISVHDTRVERPPHYDTFAEFNYAYHYGDVHIPYLKQEEPLKVECQHFLDCIRNGTKPLTDGAQGLRVVRILEALSRSLKQNGSPMRLAAEPPRHSLLCREPAPMEDIIVT